MHAYFSNGQLQPVPDEQWRHLGVPGMVGLWRGAGFEVVKFTAPAPAVARLAVRRLNGPARVDHRNPSPAIEWDTLQQIKNECGFVNQEAVEIYPPHGDAVVTANVRHLWILAERTAFSWRLAGPDKAPHYFGTT